MSDAKPIRNVVASVRQRLKNWAQANDTVFDLVLQRYAAERFLYRLGVSSEVDRFTLKGAALLLVWGRNQYRATRDVDLHRDGIADHEAIRQGIIEICAVEDPQDGLTFDPTNMRIEAIRREAEGAGIRVKLVARLGNARIPLQVDIGFGDAIHPDREEVAYPTLLDHAAPRVWAYPRETAIAQKFEAMVSLGLANTRMKDFWDVVALSQHFEFDGETLRTAIDETFRERRTPIRDGLPEALSPAFYADERRAEMWQAFQQKSDLRMEVPSSFPDVGERVIEFLGPVHSSLASDEDFSRTWLAGEGVWAAGGGRDSS